MKIHCQECHSTYQINSEKIPEKGAKATCKNCDNKIFIKRPDGEKEHILSLPEEEPASMVGVKKKSPDPVPPPLPEALASPSSVYGAPETAGNIQPGISENDLSDFISVNSYIYMEKFKSFNKNGVDSFEARWHWPAFLFPPCWFLYRKLYVWALLSFFLGFIPVVNLLARIAWGLTGNYIYYLKAKNKISAIKAGTISGSGEDLSKALQKYGGINRWAWGLAAVPILGILAAIAIPNFLAYRGKAYDMNAKLCLEQAIATQDVFYDHHQTYAGTVSDLIENSDNFAVNNGITLEIFPAGNEAYFMEGFHENGKKRYAVTGPDGDIFQMPRHMKEVVTDYRECKFMIPTDWEKISNLNEDADFQVGSYIKDVYFIAFIENIHEVDDIEIDEYSNITRIGIVENLLNPNVSRVDINPINGYETIQYRIKGTLPQNRVSIIYIHTVIKSEENFYQLVGWTTASQYNVNKKILEYLPKRFVEL